MLSSVLDPARIGGLIVFGYVDNPSCRRGKSSHSAWQSTASRTHTQHEAHLLRRTTYTTWIHVHVLLLASSVLVYTNTLTHTYMASPDSSPAKLPLPSSVPTHRVFFATPITPPATSHPVHSTPTISLSHASRLQQPYPSADKHK